MAGSFQRIIKRMQQLLFGEEINENTEGKRKSLSSDRGHEKSDSPMRVLGEQESGVKIFHQYPKQGKFRFPLDIDHVDRAERLREHRREKDNAKKKEREDLQASKSSALASASSDTTRDSTEKEIEYKEVESTKPNTNDEYKMSSQRTYFQGNDFQPENIPSPVFGFQHVPLHPDYLKKGKETILPVDDEAKREANIEEAFPVIGRRVLEPNINNAVPSVKTTQELEESEEWKEAIEEEDAEEGNESLSVYEEPAAAEEIEEKTELIRETEPETKPTSPPLEAAEEEPANTVEIEDSNKERKTLPREERRRLQREERKAKKKQTGDKNNSVPFNVLMYSKEQKKTPKTTPKLSLKENTSLSSYQFPGLQLLNVPPRKSDMGEEALQAQRDQLEATLHNFNVNAQVIDVTMGPSVTRFEVQPAPGVKVNKITNLTDDIKLALAAKDLRMEAPIPGKNAIGIEVPNPKSTPVFIREILRRDVFTRSTSPLTVAMGLDISGNPIVADLQKMPHGLIAGATGSGKSVCINSILLSLLYKADPEELKLMLIDPKMVELASYKEIPHLVAPVINDAKEATAGLKWAVAEMENRYEKLAHEGVRDIKKYNERMQDNNQKEKKMPYIVIIIDELADLMMVSPQDVEDSVCRIAQKARACGIHLLLATQRPSVDVITGLIKANIPSRTAFAVSSQADSRTILDMGGAERLIGKGDMLFHENGSPKPVRVQGTFVSDEEIDAVTDFVKGQKKPAYLFNREELMKKISKEETEDELFEEACTFVAEQGSASASLLQRRFSIGYNRAAKLIDMMEDMGIVSESMGSKPRRILMTASEIEENILA